MEVNFNFEENEEYFPLSFDGLQIIDNTRNPVIKPLEVTENGEYTVPEGVHGFNPVKVDVSLKDEGYYGGEYSVTPKFENQTLKTKNKVMGFDVNIKTIPIEKISNSSGGNTVIIGG